MDGQVLPARVPPPEMGGFPYLRGPPPRCTGSTPAMHGVHPRGLRLRRVHQSNGERRTTRASPVSHGVADGSIGGNDRLSVCPHPPAAHLEPAGMVRKRGPAAGEGITPSATSHGPFAMAFAKGLWDVPGFPPPPTGVAGAGRPPPRLAAEGFRMIRRRNIPVPPAVDPNSALAEAGTPKPITPAGTESSAGSGWPGPTWPSPTAS